MTANEAIVYSSDGWNINEMFNLLKLQLDIESVHVNVFLCAHLLYKTVFVFSPAWLSLCSNGIWIGRRSTPPRRIMMPAHANAFRFRLKRMLYKELIRAAMRTHCARWLAWKCQRWVAMHRNGWPEIKVIFERWNFVCTSSSQWLILAAVAVRCDVEYDVHCCAVLCFYSSRPGDNSDCDGVARKWPFRCHSEYAPASLSMRRHSGEPTHFDLFIWIMCLV